MTRIIIFIYLLSAFSLSATHNRAGEITYKRIPPYTKVVGGATVTAFHYSITVTKYTDHGSGIADRCVDTVYFGDGNRGVAPRVNGPADCNCGAIDGVSVTCGELILNLPNYKVKKNIYVIVHEYAGAGSYLIRSFDPNRNAGISNIPNSVNLPFYIESLIILSQYGGNNHSAMLPNPPIDMGVVGSCFNHNTAAYDEDGDSLSYQLVPCKGVNGQSVQGYSFPSANSLLIGSDGILTWCSPVFQDEFQLAIVVSEWRRTDCSGNYQLAGYVLRDMQVLVNGTSNPSLNAGLISDTCIAAGTSLTRNVTATSTTLIRAELMGSPVSTGPNPAVITPTSAGQVFNGTISWTPGCMHVRRQPHVLNLIYSLSTSNNPRFSRQFRITVAPPAPQVYSIQTDTSKVVLKWHSLKNCLVDLAYYKVYRKIGSSTWSHGACETGVPANSGYIFESYVGAGDSSYTDNNLWTTQSGSLANYIVTAVTWDCLESFAKAVSTSPLIVELEEEQDSQWIVYPNPSDNGFKVQYKRDAGMNVKTTILSVDGKIIEETSPVLRQGFFEIHTTLAPGIYFLRISTGNQSFTTKLIKN